MAQKIKKQLWRTMPYFMIFSLLLSSVIGGVVFNFDFKIVKSEKTNNISLKISKPEVKADTASTTVTVKNAPPTFSVDPAEIVVSTSTSPVNVGNSISFQGTGDDPEGHEYYLIICSSDGATANNGGSPLCTATTFCISGLTVDNTQASCTYGSVADLAPETQEWYAFVCDEHATEAECSPVGNQGPSAGVGDSSSPFYVNHEATIDAVSTTVNDQGPGGTFTVTATSTDTDVMGGDDVLTLTVCSTNSWATSTGCAVDTFCTATGTDAISCDWTDIAPTVDQNYSYWAFIVDHHDMNASNNGQTNTYTIINVAPQVSGVYLVPNNGADILLNLKGAVTNLIASSTTIVDQNGCADLVSATSSIYWSSAAGAQECGADDNNCYQIASGNCTISNCVGAQATVTCDTDLEHFARPTDISSDVPGTIWLAGIRAFDEALSGVGTTTAGTDIQTTSALEVNELNIAYGSLKAGENSGTSTATTTIVNFGNSPLDVDLTGTDMVDGGNTIEIYYQEHSLLAGFNYGTGQDATSTPSVDTETITSPRPTSLGDVEDHVYWGIDIPFVQSGDYSGVNTFSVRLDASEW